MSTKQRKRVAGGSDGGEPRPVAREEAQVAAPPGVQARARTGVKGGLLLAAGVVGLLLVGLLGVFFFAPQFLPGGGSTPAPVIPYSSEGRIAFVRIAEDGKRDLYVVNPDGTNQQQVTNGYIIESGISWSPDGKRLVVQVSVEGVSTIVRVTVGPDNKPSDAVQLTADVKADSANPAWSPDGKRIAFQSKREGGEAQIFVMDPDGNNKRRISDNKGYAGQPAWSPDSKNIVYVGGENQAATVKELFVVPLEGGAPKGITQRGTSLSQPRWTSDGNFIIFVEGARGSQSVILTKPDGKSPRVLAETGRNAQPSPDADKVAYDFVTQQQGSDASQQIGSNVFVVSIEEEGGAPANITIASQDDYMPTWSPDGKRLAWAGIPSGKGHKVLVAQADGSNLKPASTGEGDDYLPLWGPVPK